MSKELDTLIEELCESGEYMSLNVYATRNGEPIYAKTAGYADRENGIRTAPDTIFHLFSMSKPVTAAAVMKLWEDGRIDLLDPVSKYLPAFEGQKVRGADGVLRDPLKPVFIQDLLNMTSGIPYPTETDETPEMNALFDEAMAAADTPRAMTTRELADRIGSIPLVFEPGQSWRYGASADVLGALVEAVSGMRFGEYLQKNFFDPLGMEDTGFFVPPEKLHRLATIYRMPPHQEPVAYHGRHLVILDYTSAPAFESGGAGLFSTVKDYAAFGEMLLNEGVYHGRRILDPETVRFMRAGQLDARQQADFGWPSLRGYTYGSLMRILVSPGQQGVVCGPGAFGWDGWTGPYVELHPEKKVCFVLMTAQIDCDTTPNLRKIRNRFYRAFHV